MTPRTRAATSRLGRILPFGARLRHLLAERMLRRAARAGDASGCRRALEAGARPDATSVWARITPLHLGALGGHATVVRLVMSAGANPNARTRRGSTPLLLAAQGGHH